MKPFTTTAVCIFTLVSLTHLCRIFTGWEVTVAGTAIPIWASYLGALLAGGLAFMLWRESCSGKGKAARWSLTTFFFLSSLDC